MPFSSERGFVDAKPAQQQDISANLQENVELRVEITAYPPPLVYWRKDGAPIKGDKTITFRQEQEIRSGTGPVPFSCPLTLTLPRGNETPRLHGYS